MFGNIAFDASTAIDRHNNFRNIFQANLMLFRYIIIQEVLFNTIIDSTDARLEKHGQIL